MAQVLADEGAQKILNYLKSSGATWTLCLFTNNHTPADTDTVASYTEAAGGGYAAISLTLASATVSIVGGIAQIAWGDQTFTFTGEMTGQASAYGYFIKDSTTLITAEMRLDSQGAASPVKPTQNGDSYKVVAPKMQLSKGTPT